MVLLICGIVAGASITLAIENAPWDEARIIWRFAKLACREECAHKKKLRKELSSNLD